MFTTLIVQPIFNLLVLIYALLPGHNFGLAIIIFTVIVRLLMWPLVKKQLHQTKQMRKIQPELKRIKQAAKGDKRKEQTMMMELYKERGINPFGSIGILLLQIPVLLGLYSGLRRVLHDPHSLVTFSYSPLQHLPWMQELAHNIHRFDGTLFGVVDLTRSALSTAGTYWPAMVIVVGSAAVQYLQSSQLMPKDKDARSLRKILKDAGSGKAAEQAEVNAAVGRSSRFLIPVMILFFTVNLASALGLYWLVSGLVAYIQQSIILREDTDEMEARVDNKAGSKRQVIEGEVVEAPAAAEDEGKAQDQPAATPSKPKPTRTPSRNRSKKRRKK